MHRVAIAASGADAGDGPWDDDLRSIERSYLNSGGEFLVGLVGVDFVAMGALRATAARRFEVKRMRVHPEHQRRGFGAALLRALEQRAIELGAHALHLDTAEAQIAAQALYRSHGYKLVGKGNVLGLPSRFYEKVLA